MISLNAGDSGGKEEIDALSYRDEFSIDEEGRKVIWILAHSSLNQMILEPKCNHSLKGQAFVSVYPERLVLVLPDSVSAKHGGRRHLLKSESLMVERIHFSIKALMEGPAEDRTVVENNKLIKWADCCEHMTILNEPETQCIRTTGAFEISTVRVCCTDQSARHQVAGLYLRVEFKQPNIVEWIPLISESTDLVSPRKEMGWRKMEEANGYERDYRRLMDCPNNNNWRTISIIIKLLENRFDDNDKWLGYIIGKSTRQRIPGAAIRAARPIEKGTFDWIKISTVTLLEGYNADAFWKKDYTRSICTRSIWDWELEPKNEVLGAKKDCGLDIGGHKRKYSLLVVIRDGLGKNNGEDTRRTKFMGERVLVEPKEKEPHDHYNIDMVYCVNDGMIQCKIDGPSKVLGASTRCRVKARLTGHKDEKGSRELYAEQPSPDDGEDEILQHIMWKGYQSRTMEFGEVLEALGGKKMTRVYQKLQEKDCTCMCIGMDERIKVIRDNPWKQGEADTHRVRKTDWLTFMKESGLQVRDIWGLESQAEAMRNYRMLSKVEVVEARLGYLRHINARSRVTHKEHKTETRCYLEAAGGGAGGAAGGGAGGAARGEAGGAAHEGAGGAAQGSAFMEEDDIKRRVRYVGPEYDESNAYCVLESYLDSGADQTYDLLRMDMLSPESDLDCPEGTEDGAGKSQHGQGQFGDVAMGIEAGKSDVSGPEGAGDSCKNGVPSRMELLTDGGGLWAHHKRVDYGSKGSPYELMRMLEQPGRVAPPEGIGTELDVGGAGLPIPEGCLSMAWRDGQDGQSDLGDDRVRASARPMGYMEARQRLGPSTLEVASRVTRRPVARRIGCPRLGGGARRMRRHGGGARRGRM